MTSMYILSYIDYSYSLKVVQRSAAIPDPRVDKMKAHAHNASLEGVARERESARIAIARCANAISIRVVNTRFANARSNAKPHTYALINFCPIPRSIGNKSVTETILLPFIEVLHTAVCMN